MSLNAVNSKEKWYGYVIEQQIVSDRVKWYQFAKYFFTMMSSLYLIIWRFFIPEERILFWCIFFILFAIVFNNEVKSIGSK